MTIFSRRKSLYVLMLLGIITTMSCSKDLAPPVPPEPPIAVNPEPVGTIHFQNNAPTAVRLIVNGTPSGKMIASGASMDLTGQPGTPAFIVVEATTVDGSGQQVGLTITMNDQLTFPEDKAVYHKEINIPSDYFFLRVTNTQQIPTDQVVINYQMSDETVSDVSGTPMKTTQYGYYLADKNSGRTNIKVIRSKSSYYEWNFADQKLPGEENQVIGLKVY